MKCISLVLFILSLGLVTSMARQRIVVSGNVRFHPGIQLYSLSKDRFSEKILGFSDSDGLLDSAFSYDSLTLVLEKRSGGALDGYPLYELRGLSTGSPGPLSSATVPALFSGADNGLYPSLKEPLPSVYYNDESLSDSDEDGVSNSADAFPNDASETTDSDGDGQGNNADPDDDDDLMTDAYELANNLNPLVNDGDLDPDKDGQTSLQEFIAGTLANDATSLFQLEPVPHAPKNFRFPVRAGRTYRALATTDLATPFDPLGNPVAIAENSTRTISSPDVEAFFLKIEITLTNP